MCCDTWHTGRVQLMHVQKISIVNNPINAPGTSALRPETQETVETAAGHPAVGCDPLAAAGA